jgi:hypothetical protein
LVSVPLTELEPLLTAHADAVKATAFDDLQQQWRQLQGGKSFADSAADAASTMTAARLLAFSPVCAAAVRAYFYCSLHVGAAFAGDGFLYDSLGQAISEEWLAQNVPLHIDGHTAAIAHVPVRFLQAAKQDVSTSGMTSPAFSSRSVVRYRSKRLSQPLAPGSAAASLPTSSSASDTESSSETGAPGASAPVEAGAASRWPAVVVEHPLLTALVTSTVVVLSAWLARRRQTL